MSIRILPAVKGAITGVLMLTLFLIAYYSNVSSYSPLQYAIYGIYGLGIIWTLLAYRRSGSFTGKFGDLFSQGFRCFIVVTLIMVVFTFVFSRMNPEIAEKNAEAYSKELQKNPPKDMFPADIEKEVANAKKNYNTVVLYGAIFGYLIIGAGVTAVVAGLLTRRN